MYDSLTFIMKLLLFIIIVPNCFNSGTFLNTMKFIQNSDNASWTRYQN